MRTPSDLAIVGHIRVEIEPVIASWRNDLEVRLPFSITRGVTRSKFKHSNRFFWHKPEHEGKHKSDNA